jgi:hypothetical protein
MKEKWMTTAIIAIGNLGGTVTASSQLAAKRRAI